MNSNLITDIVFLYIILGTISLITLRVANVIAWEWWQIATPTFCIIILAFLGFLKSRF